MATQPQTVALKDPNGGTFNATTPAEITNLVFGSGYTFKDKDMTADKAAEILATKGPVAADIAEAAVPGSTDAAPKGRNVGG